MGDKGAQTRERILDVSQRLILRNGFSGTAIDEIIYEAGITKGGFFYHFKNRGDLARQLIVRFLEEDTRILSELIDRARSLVDDPFQQVLAFLKLYSETVEHMDEVHPGCLVASYTYESNQFSPEIRELAREGVEAWKRLFTEQFERVLEEYDTSANVEDLADMLNALIEGGIVLSRLNGDNTLLARQMLQFRDYLQSVFTRKPGARSQG